MYLLVHFLKHGELTPQDVQVSKQRLKRLFQADECGDLRRHDI